MTSGTTVRTKEHGTDCREGIAVFSFGHKSHKQSSLFIGGKVNESLLMACGGGGGGGGGGR